MVERCTNPNSAGYKNYGGRGITICSRWLRFDLFLEDMGVPPKGYTLDRRDNDKGYSPENCRWATPKQQRANQRARAPSKRALQKQGAADAKDRLSPLL
jgi:hypothetical protein